MWLIWLVNWIYSILIFGLIFYIPGRLVLKKIDSKIKENTNFVLSIILGIAFWGLQGYILGYLKLRWLTYGYILFTTIFWLRYFKYEYLVLITGIKQFWQDKWLGLIIGIGLIVTLAGVFPSGLPSKDGVWIYGNNIIDGSYHLSLTSSLIRNIPPEEPGMAGELVKNYHYWSDLVLAEIIRIFKVPNIYLFYQYFPVFLVTVLGLVSFLVGEVLGKNKNTGRILSFLVLFGGNWGWLLMLILKGKLTFGMETFDNAAILFMNPPRAIAETVFLGGLLTVIFWIRTEKISWGWIAALILGTCVGFKVYFGVFAALGLIVLGFFWLIKRKWKMIIPLVAAALISAVIFLPANIDSGGFLYRPFAWPRHYFAQGEAAVLQWHLQEDEFKAHNNIKRITILYGQMTFVFLLITYGIRSLGILGIWHGIKKMGWLTGLFLLIPTLVGNILGLFFLLESGPYEIFNFLIISSLVLSIFTAILVNHFILKYKNWNWLILFLLIVLTIPRSAVQANKYLSEMIQKKEAYLFSNDELALFKIIKNKVNNNELIMVNPTDSVGRLTPYLVSFTDKRIFLGGVWVLKAHGLKVDTQERTVDDWWQLKGSDLASKLKQNNIKYLYLRDGINPVGIKDDDFFKIIDRIDNKLFLEVL